MAYIPASLKVIERWRKEDIELHQRVITSYLHQIGANVTTRNKFFALYKRYVTPANILCYIHKPVRIFVIALVQDRLDEICDYILSPLEKPRKRKSNKKK